jgi:protein TonB
MKLGLLLGIIGAALLHAGFLLFGGLLFRAHDQSAAATVQEVDLLTTADQPQQKQEELQPPEPQAQEEVEAAPDASDALRELDTPEVNQAPALDAASLSAIEAALSGQPGAGGEFGEVLTFASGGRIGGTGKAGALEEGVDSAFSLAEIDQKPRAVFQAAPVYPARMRGRRVDGVVTVIFIVDASGKVANPRVEQSSDSEFDKPALEAVRKWKFEPAVRGGQRVACKMRVPIRFQPG